MACRNSYIYVSLIKKSIIMTKSNFTFRTLFIGILFLLASASDAVSQTKAEQIDQLLKRYAEYGEFNGSALVAEQGKPIYRKGFGMANMEWDIPNAPNTKHRLGSITKQFTATLILQLAEQGKLKLDVPITAYLPDYPKANGDQITIHHLLTHTSGIPNYTSFPNFYKDLSKKYYSPADFVKQFCELPLEFKPGEKWNYSNSGYFLLGYIIEKVTGKTYEACLQENIFIPLHMNDSGFDHFEKILKNRAAAYEKEADGYVNAQYLDMNLPYAAGSIYSTVEDLFLWNEALYSEKLLTKKSLDLMFANHFAVGRDYYGYGWFVSETADVKPGAKINITQHGGGINGFNTIISRITTDRNCVILLNNTGHAPLEEMNRAIQNILYGKPYEMPKKSIAKTVLATMNSKGLAAGMTQFREIKKSDIYKLEESEVNLAGYQLLQSGKVAEAIEMFKINAEAFPKSGNVYDSLGEAYLKNGNKELAIVNYKKSVALDPKNEAGKKVLDEISKK
jgi:CubicO group peptidase (beta-lactamase class C family)